ncbi:MAG TPA: DPP IV N-terminal domain-containing protein [Terracidiphilus sp.]|nr:DPP IV N-terminal domain-containing protein [Terracidiphilus sp.]
MKAKCFLLPLLFGLSFAAVVCCCAAPARAQDWVHTGTNLGQQKIRLGAADFKPMGTDPQTPQLKATFDSTLFNDLQNAGIFDMVSKSMSPQGTPGSPQEISLAQWAAEPANATDVAFGAFKVENGRLTVFGWLDDTRNTTNPQVLTKQYNEAASQDMARTIAHRFADEIIAQLGGGVNGIAETKIYFVSDRTGTKEIWVMDYDGENQHQITHLGSTSLSPRISPDNSRIAFSSLSRDGWAIRMWSMELGRIVSFPGGTAGGNNFSPAWSGDGSKIAFASSRSGSSEIWAADTSGGNLHQLTSFQRAEISPTWNPRSNSQVAFVSGRTGEPQVYTMDADGSNVQRITDGGYAVSPSWSPNGQLLAFAWNRKYGPGDPGKQDIHVLELASKNYLQITHESGSNDFPSWSPDGRHLVFERQIGKRTEIWSMLADGTQQVQLTNAGSNYMPNWSWK